MPRRPRVALGGLIYHVVHRGVRRETLFFDPADYKHFQRLLIMAGNRFGVDLLGYCLMPNHWHLVLRPLKDRSLSAYVQWLASAHARYTNACRGFSGHVYERRFRSIVVRDERQLVTLLHYVESNPVRAHLVVRAEFWQWSSVVPWAGLTLAASPYQRPSNWLDLLAEGTSGAKSLVMT
jgi:putative transposase